MAAGDQAHRRMLPQDIEAERAVLGSMLHGRVAVAAARAELPNGGAEFARERHATTFGVLCEIADTGEDIEQSIDGNMVRTRLQRLGKWEKFGGFNFLADLLSAVPSALRAGYYAELVHKKYLERSLLLTCHRTICDVQSGDKTTDDLLAGAEREILKLAEQRVTDEPTPIAADIAAMLKQMESEDPTGIGTTYFRLDEITGGMMPGELVLIGARPSVGKTALMLNIADRLAVSKGYRALIFSLEMRRFEIIGRMLTSRSGVPMRAVKRKDLTPDQDRRLAASKAELEEAGDRIIVDAPSRIFIDELCARARVRNNCRDPIDIVFVDYLQLVQVRKRYERRDLEVGAVASQLKALAKDLNAPVVAAVQLNRGTEEQKRPRMSNLRESGELEQHADQVWLLHRERRIQEATNGARSEVVVPETQVIVEKNRNGRRGELELLFRPEAARFDAVEGTSLRTHHEPGEPDSAEEPVGAGSQLRF